MARVRANNASGGGGDNTFIESFLCYRIPGGWYASATDENKPSGTESNTSHNGEYLNITTSGTSFVITAKKKCRVLYKEITGSYQTGVFDVGDTILSFVKNSGANYEFAFVGVYG